MMEETKNSAAITRQEAERAAKRRDAARAATPRADSVTVAIAGMSADALREVVMNVAQTLWLEHNDEATGPDFEADEHWTWNPEKTWDAETIESVCAEMQRLQPEESEPRASVPTRTWNPVGERGPSLAGVVPASELISVENGATQQFDDDGVPESDMATCGVCGLTWDDALITGRTPAPSGRCPYEAWHADEEGDDAGPSLAECAESEEAAGDRARIVKRTAAEPTYSCDDCDATGTVESLGIDQDNGRTLAEIHHLASRLDHGGIVPVGECKCGALAYLDEGDGIIKRTHGGMAFEYPEDDATTDAAKIAIAKAREVYALPSSDDIEIDDNPKISKGECGTWVAAWLWVRDPEGEEVTE